MFKDVEAFSGFSVSDVAATRQFYSEVLGMEVSAVAGMEDYGLLELHIKNGHNVLLYHKDDHQPASFTVLSFPVDAIDTAVDQLLAKGVAIIDYHNEAMPQDEKGIARGIEANQGPDIAWFTDPSGNVLAVLQAAS